MQYTIWNDAASPSRLVALDASTGRLLRTVLAAGDVPPGRRLESISFVSSDGQLVQGWIWSRRETGWLASVSPGRMQYS